MDYAEFSESLQMAVPPGTILNNPGKGTSTVISYPDGKVSYKRGGARFYVSIRDLYDAYKHFKGQLVDTSDLKSYAPTIFDSTKNGHSCHCTFLFLSLQRMGIVDEIQGQGVRGSPFSVDIKDA